MSWHCSWEGRATDFIPELLVTRGNPGRVAMAANNAVWEVVQGIAEQDSTARVKVAVRGMETPDNPGLGEFHMSVLIEGEPSELQQRLTAQRPVDLLRDPNRQGESAVPLSSGGNLTQSSAE